MPGPDRRTPVRRLRNLVASGVGRVRQASRGTPWAADLSNEVDPVGSLLEESFIRRLENLNLLTRGVVAPGLVGEHRSRRYAISTEFADYRQYVPGDDFRRIDWNAFARTDGLFIRQTEANEDLAVHLLLDCSQSMNWGTPNKLGFARRVAAAIGFLALARFDAVSAITFADAMNGRFPLVRGKGQSMRLLTFLDEARVGGVTNLERVVAEFCNGRVRSGIAFLISDLLSEDSWERAAVNLLGTGMDVVVVQIIAPQELHPAVDGEVELFDSETGDVVELVVGPEARRTYEQRMEEWCARVGDFCSRSEIGYLRLESDLTLEDIFLNRMRQRRIVR